MPKLLDSGATVFDCSSTDTPGARARVQPEATAYDVPLPVIVAEVSNRTTLPGLVSQAVFRAAPVSTAAEATPGGKEHRAGYRGSRGCRLRCATSC